MYDNCRTLMSRVILYYYSITNIGGTLARSMRIVLDGRRKPNFCLLAREKQNKCTYII